MRLDTIHVIASKHLAKRRSSLKASASLRAGVMPAGRRGHLLPRRWLRLVL